MTFSQYAGTAIVPTLARLVLAAAFVSTGWNKVFKDAEFTADQATRLRNLGVNVEPVKPIVDARQWMDRGGMQPLDGSDLQIVLAAYVQDPANAPATAPAGSPPATPAAPAESKPVASPPPASTGGAAGGGLPQSGPLPPGTYTAQRLHTVTLMLESANFPQPVWMARLAAFTELVGGAMLLLGLFSRIWGLGLAIAMGTAFYLVSMKMNNIFATDPRVFALDVVKFNTAYCQAGLFVLAFGIFLTGPGPLSLDRMLFGGGEEEEVAAGEVKID
jgi:uncharacterized membrane protein YphA (DoxX/SURF4 family)